MRPLLVVLTAKPLCQTDEDRGSKKDKTEEGETIKPLCGVQYDYSSSTGETQNWKISANCTLILPLFLSLKLLFIIQTLSLNTHLGKIAFWTLLAEVLMSGRKYVSWRYQWYCGNPKVRQYWQDLCEHVISFAGLLLSAHVASWCCLVGSISFLDITPYFFMIYDRHNDAKHLIYLNLLKSHGLGERWRDRKEKDPMAHVEPPFYLIICSRRRSVKNWREPGQLLHHGKRKGGAGHRLLP